MYLSQTHFAARTTIPSRYADNKGRQLPLLRSSDLKSKQDFLEKLMRRDFCQWVNTRFVTSQYAFAVRVEPQSASYSYPLNSELILEPKTSLYPGEEVLVQNMVIPRFDIVRFMSSGLWVRVAEKSQAIDYPNTIILGKIIGVQVSCT